MTQLHPRDLENRQQNRLSERRLSKKKNNNNKTVATGWIGNWALSTYNTQFVSVELTGEKNQVTLEFMICSLVRPYYEHALLCL